MPADYEIKDGVVLSRASGRFTFEEAKSFRTRLTSDPNFKPTIPHLIDFSDVDEMDFTFDEIRELAFEDPFGDRIRRAIVAPEGHAFGVARMYEALARTEGLALGVFRDLDSARKWLGLEP